MRTDGYLFQLDRATGTPIFPIEDRPVPQDAVPDVPATQPFPVGAERIGPQLHAGPVVADGFTPGCYFDVIKPDMPNPAQPYMTMRFSPMAYSPQTGYFYVTTCVDPKLLLRGEDGWGGLGGTFLRPPGFKLYGRLSRHNSRTNKIAWRKRSPPRTASAAAPWRPPAASCSTRSPTAISRCTTPQTAICCGSINWGSSGRAPGCA